MRVGHVQMSRPAYFDRNPATKQVATRTLANAPANFVDVSYTVPSGKKAYLQAASAKIIRVTAAGALGRSAAIAEYLQAAVNFVDVCEAALRKNAVGDADSATFGGVGLLVAGEKFQTEIQSSDTGGTIDYLATGWLVEFDA